MNLDQNKPEYLDLMYTYKTVSSKDPNTIYITILAYPYNPEEDDMCTCPGFKFNKTCRHMTEARKHLDDISR